MKRLTTEEFITKANFIHSSKYDYSKTNYIKTNLKIKILCSVHGEFQQIPNSHLMGTGCPKCAIELVKNKKYLNTNLFIQKAAKIHNDLYDYSLVNYKTTHTKISIICNKHGEFKQTPNAHLCGKGCLKCSTITPYTTEKFIEIANKRHNNFYNYLKSIYKGSFKNIKIICPVHGIFVQKAGAHLRGQGCPKCVNKIGYSKSKWIYYCNNKKTAIPIVYIIRCFNKNENFIKIGITANSISKRFHSTTLPYLYEVIKEIKGTASFVWDTEKKLHKNFKNFIYTPKLHFDGETECFNISILDLI